MEGERFRGKGKLLKGVREGEKKTEEVKGNESGGNWRELEVWKKSKKKNEQERVYCRHEMKVKYCNAHGKGIWEGGGR